MRDKSVFKSAVLGLATLLGGCTKSVVHDETQPYMEAMGGIPASGVAASHPRLNPFLRMFSDITPSSIHNNIEEVYASELFFNDTFHTFKTREEIKLYFLSFARSAVVTVEPLNVLEQGDDLWLQWKMRLQFTVGKKELDITSIGISHLKFNQDGQIVLHQDFWDGANGFYAHLPMIGRAIRLVQGKIAEATTGEDREE